MLNKKTLMAALAVLRLAGTTGMAIAADHDHDGRPDHSYAERHDRDNDRDGDGRANGSWAERHDRDTYRDRDHDGRPNGSWAERHDRDRYWKPGFRGYIGHDRVFFNLRNHGYARYVGNPYFYRGRYVVRSYNRWGRI